MTSVPMLVGVIGARDPGSTRLVYGIVVALVLVGVGSAWLAWWLARTSRPDPELLAPLEAIQTRRWRRLDPAGRRRLLDDLRPDGAEPEHREPRTPDLDDEFVETPAPRDVRDLANDPADDRAHDSGGDGGDDHGDDLWEVVDDVRSSD